MGKKICDSRTWFKNEFSKNSDIHMLTDEELKKLHDIELEMLCDFLKVVKEQNISYTMSGGSVLGTIRHGGFIPWDDDIDINMPDLGIFSLKILAINMNFGHRNQEKTMACHLCR